MEAQAQQFHTASGGQLSVISRALRPSTVQEVIGFQEFSNGGVQEPGTNIDPYAHFLSIDRGRYQAELTRRGYPELPPDRGNAFANRKWSYLSDPITGTVPSGAYSRRIINGHLLPYTPSMTSGSLLGPWMTGLGPETMPALQGFAQRALADARPTLAEFSLSNFLGEIREGLPKAISSAGFFQERGRYFKGIGKDYLNAQFGWVPFLSDLQKLAYALFRAQSKLNAITGTPVRRHLKGPKVTDTRQNTGVQFNLGATSGSADGTVLPITGESPYPYAIGVGNGTVIETIDSTLNFSGSFVTLLPESFDDSAYLDRFWQLVDLRVTPSVLWNLSPWTWLVDWFLDIQGVIDANLQVGDENLLIHYAYASQKITYRALGWVTDPFFGYTGDKLACVIEGTHYRRVRANPYGFTVGTFGGLSTSQLAILGALGLSRGR